MLTWRHIVSAPKNLTLVAMAASVLTQGAGPAAAEAMSSPNSGSAPATAQTKSAAQWYTLGTSGGPAVRPSRAQISNALVVNGAVYLFDLGDGVRRQMAKAGVPEGKVKAVFITHHHVDHNADLGPVMVARWAFDQGLLPIIGPVGTEHLAHGLAAANAPTVLASFPTGGPAKPPLDQYISPRDLPLAMAKAQQVYSDENIKVWAIGVDHYQMSPSVPLPEMPDAVAYRIEAGGRTFVYTGDSGPSERLRELARGADVLITEIVQPEAMVKMIHGGSEAQVASVRRGMSVNHLVAGEVGRMARDAKVSEVVITHLVPAPEDSPLAGHYVADVKAIYSGKVTLAQDLDRF